MRAAPWKSGPSGPRKLFRISDGFSRCGNDLSRRRVFPQSRKPCLFFPRTFGQGFRFEVQPTLNRLRARKRPQRASIKYAVFPATSFAYFSLACFRMGISGSASLTADKGGSGSATAAAPFCAPARRSVGQNAGDRVRSQSSNRAALDRAPDRRC